MGLHRKADDKPRARITQLSVFEVSHVDRAANKRTYLLTKRGSVTEDQLDLNATLGQLELLQRKTDAALRKAAEDPNHNKAAAELLRSLAKDASTVADAIDPPAEAATTNETATEAKEPKASDTSAASAGDQPAAQSAAAVDYTKLAEAVAAVLMPTVEKAVEKTVEAKVTKATVAGTKPKVLVKTGPGTSTNTRVSDGQAASGFEWPSDLAAAPAQKGA